MRAGQFPSKADGTATVAQIKAAGYASSVLYTGWDGDAETSGQTRGPWKLEVLTIDPKKFRGELSSSFGPNLQDRKQPALWPPRTAHWQPRMAVTSCWIPKPAPRATRPGPPSPTGKSSASLSATGLRS